MKRKNRIFRKIRNYILKTFTLIMGIVFMLSICSLDSDSWIPFVAIAISGGWLWLYAWANGYVYNDDEEGDEE